MPNNPLVFNETRRYSLSFKQARKAVENCSAEWVEYGISIRDLTLAQSVARRNEQARLRTPLESPELPGLVYQPCAQGQAIHRQGYELVKEANKLVYEAA